MRARIDITEVEQATKIRAKYLRAIENEEWDLLPGSTFVKSFLREYAKYLGLDARLLVEEYKLRYERPSEHELVPIHAGLGRERGARGRGAGRGGPPRWALPVGLLVALVVLLYVLGSRAGDDDPGAEAGRQPTITRPATTPARPDDAPARTAPTPTRAAVRIVPTGPLYVCLVDGGGRILIPGTEYAAGEQVPSFRARRLLLTLGNNQVRLRANGRAVRVPASSTGIAYELTPRGARAIPLSAGPTCT